MNPNQPTPDPSLPHDDADINAAITKNLRAYRWKGRALTFAALCVGLLSILAGIMIAWASSMMVMPMERLLLQDYPYALSSVGTNSTRVPRSEPRSPLPRAELDLRHVQVTAAHGKVLFLTAVALVLLGTGTFLTLLLVIFNRRATLRQINASLAQISDQIRDVQRGKASGS